MPLLHILDTNCNNWLKTKDHQVLNRPFEDTINCEHQLGEAYIKKTTPKSRTYNIACTLFLDIGL